MTLEDELVLLSNPQYKIGFYDAMHCLLSDIPEEPSSSLEDYRAWKLGLKYGLVHRREADEITRRKYTWARV